MAARRRKLWKWLGATVALLTLSAAGGWLYLDRAAPEYAPYHYGRADRAKLERLTLLNHEEVMGRVLGPPTMQIKRIGILVYDGVDTLEAVAPMAVFSELFNVELEYLALKPGVVATRLADLVVERSYTDVQTLDVLIVPGGDPSAIDGALAHPGLRDWLQQIDAHTQMTAGIGLGSVILADAGLLKERVIAFGWPQAEQNAIALGARFAPTRYAQDGKYWTSEPSTAALDLSLAMLGAITGPNHLQAAMLDLEYDPAPPLGGARLAGTPAGVLDALSASAQRWRGLSVLGAALDTDSAEPLEVGILVYPDFFTLDAIGPLAVLSQLKHARVRLLRWGEPTPIKSGRTHLAVSNAARDAGKLDLLLVPGGANGTWAMTQDSEALAWIRGADANSRFTASVCTGSWVLGAAGLLDGRKGTSNWYRMGQMLPRWGAEAVAARYVNDGKYWTSAGVSAGIDLSYALIAAIDGEDAARSAMVRMHYRPQPPIHGGSPERTDDLVLDMMHQMYDYSMVPLIRTEQ